MAACGEILPVDARDIGIVSGNGSTNCDNRWPAMKQTTTLSLPTARVPATPSELPPLYPYDITTHIFLLLSSGCAILTN